jgi:dynein heavy chain 1
MLTLRDTIQQWFKALPERLALIERTAENVKNPLTRYFEREVSSGAKLLKRVRQELNEIVQVCDGTLKQTNQRRALLAHLTKGTIPNEWRRYPVPSYMSISVWVLDFAERIRQLDAIRRSKDHARSGIWIGGLFNAEAYFTATRQAAAQANSWSLENLELHAEILKSNVGAAEAVDQNSFIATSLTLEAAGWDYERSQLTVSSEMNTALPQVKFSWKLRSAAEAENNTVNKNIVNLPIYLNDTRSEFLVAVDLNSDPSTSATTMYLRGSAMTVWRSNV